MYQQSLPSMIAVSLYMQTLVPNGLNCFSISSVFPLHMRYTSGHNYNQVERFLCQAILIETDCSWRWSLFVCRVDKSPVSEGFYSQQFPFPLSLFQSLFKHGSTCITHPLPCSCVYLAPLHGLCVSPACPAVHCTVKFVLYCVAMLGLGEGGVFVYFCFSPSAGNLIEKSHSNVQQLTLRENTVARVLPLYFLNGPKYLNIKWSKKCLLSCPALLLWCVI